MRTITIGRSSECDIAIEHEHISRKHAMLKLYPTGKIEIIDMGRNGTSVNGVKIQSGVAKRVHRNDVITFAGAKTLDWSVIPNEGAVLRWGVLIAGIIALLTIIAVVVINLKKPSESPAVENEFDNPINVNTPSVSGDDNAEKKDEGWFRWPDFLKPAPKKAAPKKPSGSNAGKDAPRDEQKTEPTPAPAPTPNKPNAPTKKDPAASRPAQVIM